MENTKTFEEVKAASDSVFMAWKNAGERESCDFLNNSNRDMILAYTKRYPSAKAYKMWQGIVDIDLENLHNFCFDVLFDGQPESVKQIKQAQYEIERLIAAEAANGIILIWS